MIFKFGRKKFSDVIKVVQFLDNEGIEYEVMADIEVAIAGGIPPAGTTTNTVPAVPSEPVPTSVESAPPRAGVTPVTATNDIAWKPARHAGTCGGRGVCKHGTHYGMIENE